MYIMFIIHLIFRGKIYKEIGYACVNAFGVQICKYVLSFWKSRLKHKGGINANIENMRVVIMRVDRALAEKL